MHCMHLHITARMGKGGQDVSYISSEAGHSRVKCVKTPDGAFACSGGANLGR